MTETFLPLISVVIPVFNAADTISRAIESVIQQKGVRCEIIVVDDCSIDESASIARQYVNKHSCVRLLQTECQSGPSVARNLGVNMARGQWLAFLDADDWFSDNRLFTLLTHALQYDLDVIADTYFLFRNEASKPVQFGDLLPEGAVGFVTLESFIAEGMGSLKLLVKKRFLDVSGVRYSPHTRLGEDALFGSELLLSDASFALLNIPLYFRTVSHSSLSRQGRVLLFNSLLRVYAHIGRSAYSYNRDSESLRNAIVSRTLKVQRMLATAQWRQWLASGGKLDMPPLQSLEYALSYCVSKFWVDVKNTAKSVLMLCSKGLNS